MTPIRNKIENMVIEGEPVELIDVRPVPVGISIMRYPDGTLRIFFTRSEEDGGDIQVRCEANSYSVEEENLLMQGKKFRYIWPKEMRGLIANYDAKARLLWKTSD